MEKVGKGAVMQADRDGRTDGVGPGETGRGTEVERQRSTTKKMCEGKKGHR